MTLNRLTDIAIVILYTKFRCCVLYSNMLKNNGFKCPKLIRKYKRIILKFHLKAILSMRSITLQLIEIHVLMVLLLIL